MRIWWTIGQLARLDPAVLGVRLFILLQATIRAGLAVIGQKIQWVDQWRGVGQGTWAHKTAVKSSPSASRLLHFLLHATQCRRDPTRSKQLSTVAILGFQFESSIMSLSR